MFCLTFKCCEASRFRPLYKRSGTSKNKPLQWIRENLDNVAPSQNYMGCHVVCAYVSISYVSGLFLYCVAKDFEAMSADADLHSDVDDGSSCLSSSSSSGMGLSVKGFLEEVVSQVKSDSRCLIGFLLV